MELSRALITLVLCTATFSGLAALGVLPVLGEEQGSDTAGKVNTAASVSELRAVTAEDRALASYFDREGRSLLEGEGSVRVPPPPPVPVPPPPAGMTASAPPDPIPETACRSDAIVVGHAVSSRALLNRSETFLITVYEVAVGEWIRPSRRGGTISVAMLGGDVQVQDKLLSARVRDPLTLGVPVLMFLRHVPGAPRLYVVAEPLAVANGKVSLAGFPHGPSVSQIDLSSLANILRAHGNRCGVSR